MVADPPEPSTMLFLATVQGQQVWISRRADGWIVLRWASGHEMHVQEPAVFVWPDPKESN